MKECLSNSFGDGSKLSSNKRFHSEVLDEVEDSLGLSTQKNNPITHFLKLLGIRIAKNFNYYRVISTSSTTDVTVR